MKIKKIVDICKGSGRMVLMNDSNGYQWLGDGVACYPLQDAPLFDMESLFVTFDITEKKQENILFQHVSELPEKFCFADMCDGEVFAERNDITLCYKGEEYQVYHSVGGALYVNAKYLKPINNEEMEIYQRRTADGIPYFVCKVGYMIQALIMPVKLDTNKDFTEKLDLLYEQSIRAREEKTGV